MAYSQSKSYSCYNSRLRFLHNIAATSSDPINGLPVNILIDDKIVQENVIYTQFTDYLKLSSGTHTIKVIPVNLTGVVLTLDVCLKKYRDYTVIAEGLLTDPTNYPLKLQMYKDDNRQSGRCCTKLRFIHGAAGVPPVDLYLNSSLLFSNVQYTETGDPTYKKLCPGKYQVKVTLSGTDTIIVAPEDLYFNPCKVYTLVATGLAGSQDPSTSPSAILIDTCALKLC